MHAAVQSPIEAVIFAKLPMKIVLNADTANRRAVAWSHNDVPAGVEMLKLPSSISSANRRDDGGKHLSARGDNVRERRHIALSDDDITPEIGAIFQRPKCDMPA